MATSRPPVDEYFHSVHYTHARTSDDIGGLPTPPETLNGGSRVSFPPTPSEGAIAGRKRSRGDIFSPEDEQIDGSAISEQSHVPQTHPGDPTYGPGMTLVYPNDPSGHYAVDSSAQSSAAQTEIVANGIVKPARPIMTTRKSQRVDTSVSRVEQAPLRAPSDEPLIDVASRMLGISWKRMDASETSQISQRAYTRWIDRHYPQLTQVEVWFENSAIPGYLGKATNIANGVDEYYLWSFDLHQAILVTRNPSDLIFKLSQPHMSLSQATEKINADVTPVVEAAAANAAIVHNDRFMNDFESTTAGSMELD